MSSAASPDRDRRVPNDGAPSARGEAGAFEQCEDLSPALYAWANLRIRALGNPALQAEDVVQETWMRALSSRALSSKAGDESSRGWIFGIAQNVLLEQARQLAPRSYTRSPKTDPSVTAFLDRFEDTVTSICTRLSRDETVAKLFEFVQELDELDRGLLIRCGFEEQTVSDVARRLGIEPDTAIKRWQRLRERLRTTDFARRLGLASD